MFFVYATCFYLGMVFDLEGFWVEISELDLVITNKEVFFLDFLAFVHTCVNNRIRD